MKTMLIKIKEKVWLYPGKAGWYFVTINKEDAKDIKEQYIWERRGFGAIPVKVTIGKTTWKTSVFPEKEGTYLLPLKKEVRVKEEIEEGDRVLFNIEIIN